jgi:hypothetical protein
MEIDTIFQKGSFEKIYQFFSKQQFSADNYIFTQTYLNV